MTKKLDKLFNNSPKISINDDEKIVFISDCHRGAGDNLDNFLKNQNIYLCALNYYYINGFTYIELGDGDEMWEVDDYNKIIKINLEVFKQLKKFHDYNKLIMIYGNHDISKNSPTILEKYFYKYYNEQTQKGESLLDGLKVYESLVLNYKNYDIFLIHGHQVDYLNGTLWHLSRFLVRTIWRSLENYVLYFKKSIAKNHEIKEQREKRLRDWSIKNNKIIIAGHTHRAIFPRIGESLYFNDGSCISDNGITSIEIEDGHISLIKWELNNQKDELTTIKRKVLEKKTPLINFYK